MEEDERGSSILSLKIFQKIFQIYLFISRICHLHLYLSDGCVYANNVHMILQWSQYYMIHSKRFNSIIKLLLECQIERKQVFYILPSNALEFYQNFNALEIQNSSKAIAQKMPVFKLNIVFVCFLDFTQILRFVKQQKNIKICTCLQVIFLQRHLCTILYHLIQKVALEKPYAGFLIKESEFIGCG